LSLLLPGHNNSSISTGECIIPTHTSCTNYAFYLTDYYFDDQFIVPTDGAVLQFDCKLFYRASLRIAPYMLR